jgi:ubiquinone/menaquinone biosynthesis C-methylase UbiE
MSLRHSYTLIAPIYDSVIEAATRSMRRRSLAWLAARPPSDVLLSGVGTGLDLPLAPRQHRYLGVDLTGAMLRRCLRRQAGLAFAPVQGDAQALPFRAECFDAVVLHLILAVVPQPQRCLAEAARVLRPGGSVLVLDKFLGRGQFAPLRRLANPLARRLATRLDVVFEDVLAGVPELAVATDEPALAGGWFRLIRLGKQDIPIKQGGRS